MPFKIFINRKNFMLTWPTLTDNFNGYRFMNETVYQVAGKTKKSKVICTTYHLGVGGILSESSVLL